jgi:hypothetical protein
MRRTLQVVLSTMGIGMLSIGVAGLLFGIAPSVPGPQPVTASLDSEMRFYSAWYAVGGVFLLRAVPDVSAAAFTVRVIAAGFMMAGCARLLSWAVEGRPHQFQIFLLIVELVIPFVIVPWQAVVARAEGRDVSA